MLPKSLTPLLIAGNGVLAIWTEYPGLYLTPEADARDEFLKFKAGRIEAARKKGAGTGIAVIPIYGAITKGDSGYYDEVSTDAIRSDLNTAMRDPAVKGIVLDISSPGGTVQDVPELANEIYSARQVKPVVAYANGLAASAAYWLASATSLIYSAPSAYVGSVGVYMMHMDLSKRMSDMGVNVSFVSAGKYKTEGNMYEALSPEARNNLQSEIDDIYSQFLGAVSKGRNSDPKASNFYGEGRILNSKTALSNGMIDGIGSLSDVIRQLAESIGIKQPSENDKVRLHNMKRIVELRKIFQQ